MPVTDVLVIAAKAVVNNSLPCVPLWRRPFDFVVSKPKGLTALFADHAHVEIEATWGIYQRMIAAYLHDDRRKGRELMVKLIHSISGRVPKALAEITKLGRTLEKRAADVLAYFDWPGTSNGPTEAINGLLEHLRGSALGFRNLTNYITRSLLYAGGFRPRLHPRLRRATHPLKPSEAQSRSTHAKIAENVGEGCNGDEELLFWATRTIPESGPLETRICRPQTHWKCGKVKVGAGPSWT
ncbi:hypothetical protein GCM10007175_07740 [Pseudarthrobacter scleromae]|uniref:Transposase IS204/IS1001/IS1096/IS1165 DDE domain-containing protein n=1 Tax=Pseudarthrobacter scleromae TaxID=158897 RepID=A0ABQ2CCH7_9MICC|nr:hypothetical protein GCM10007175_07740 [Pseudarthrobacter scleromae]